MKALLDVMCTRLVPLGVLYMYIQVCSVNLEHNIKYAAKRLPQLYTHHNTIYVYANAR